MRLADMHIHTTFSPDGKSSMEEQCIKAIEIGIPIICFTDHVDFNSSEINVGRIINKASTNFDVSEYFYEVNRLRRIYNSIQILIGIEFSEPHLFPTEFEDYSSMPFDYILGSIHHCYGSVFPGAKNIEESKAIDEYYNLMLKSIQTCEFQAMAHIDFPRRYFDNWNVSDTIMDEILNAMIKKDIILEVNTSSIMNASDEPLPRYSIIDRYVQLGGRRVVLGSDAHISVKLGNAFSIKLINDTHKRARYYECLKGALFSIAPYRQNCIWAMSCIDSLGMGVPVIAPDVAWFSEFIPKDLRYSSIDEAMDIIDKLINDSDFWRKKSAQANKLISSLSPESIANTFLDEFYKLIL